MKRYWSYILVAVIATAIPVSALFLEPGAGRAASSSSPDRPQKPGVLQQTDNLDYTWVLHQAEGPPFLSFREPGPPITVKTDVRRVNTGLVLVRLALEGRAGETYQPTVMKGGAHMSAPGLRIVDKQGNVIDQGRFAYG